MVLDAPEKLSHVNIQKSALHTSQAGSLGLGRHQPRKETGDRCQDARVGRNGCQTTSITSKTEVLQMPSVKEVNLFFLHNADLPLGTRGICWPNQVMATYQVSDYCTKAKSFYQNGNFQFLPIIFILLVLNGVC